MLGFIAQLSVSELPLFFKLLIKSLQFTELDNGGMEVSDKRSVDELESSSLLSLFTTEKILAIPWKKRHGFLHVVEEVLNIFDASRASPFLDLLMGCVVRILEVCASNILSRSNKQLAHPYDCSEITLPDSGEDAVSHDVRVISTLEI